LNWFKIGRPTRPRLGLLQADGLEKMLIDTIGDRRFEELDIPLAVVTTDIVAGEMVVLREGRVAPAVRASCAIPGLFTPLERDGRVLVDGGLLNNLPISVAREMGADYVIAVDLLPKTSDMRYKPQNIYEVILISIYTVMAYNRDEADKADCLIRPMVGDFSWARMSRLEAMVQKGRQAAEAAIDQIKMDLDNAL
jgi:NTE family protein